MQNCKNLLPAGCLHAANLAWHTGAFIHGHDRGEVCLLTIGLLHSELFLWFLAFFWIENKEIISASVPFLDANPWRVVGPDCRTLHNVPKDEIRTVFGPRCHSPRGQPEIFDHTRNRVLPPCWEPCDSRCTTTCQQPWEKIHFLPGSAELTLVPHGGLEPPTPCSVGRCHIH